MSARDFEAAIKREWLETNGIGGYASSTISGANTRRYHGLLVAATRPPVERMVLLSKFEETVIVDGKRYELSCNQYPGKVHPEGYQFLTGFRLDPFPGLDIHARRRRDREERSLWSTVRTRPFAGGLSKPGPNARLELRPLVAFRDHHHLAISARARYSLRYFIGIGFRCAKRSICHVCFSRTMPTR